jgi:hypothetical protein
LQALRAAHNRSLEVLAEAEARLKDETAAKAGRDEKAQQVGLALFWRDHSNAQVQRLKHGRCCTCGVKHTSAISSLQANQWLLGAAVQHLGSMPVPSMSDPQWPPHCITFCVGAPGLQAIEERAAAAALAARQLAATVTIQAAWRGFKVRPAQRHGCLAIPKACTVKRENLSQPGFLLLVLARSVTHVTPQYCDCCQILAGLRPDHG